MARDIFPLSFYAEKMSSMICLGVRKPDGPEIVVLDELRTSKIRRPPQEHGFYDFHHHVA